MLLHSKLRCGWWISFSEDRAFFASVIKEAWVFLACYLLLENEKFWKNYFFTWNNPLFVYYSVCFWRLNFDSKKLTSPQNQRNSCWKTRANPSPRQKFLFGVGKVSENILSHVCEHWKDYVRWKTQVPDNHSCEIFLCIFLNYDLTVHRTVFNNSS